MKAALQNNAGRFALSTKMPEKEKTIENEAQSLVEGHFEANLGRSFRFHSAEHTREVVAAVKQIADFEGVDGQLRKLLVLAAWFHDTGYTETYVGHEEEGCKMAGEFMQKHGLGDLEIKKVKAFIMATKFGYEPKTAAEEIIRDADSYHLSRPHYFDYLQNLREEWQARLKLEYIDLEWIRMNIQFLKNHHYFTRFAKENLSAGKMENLAELERQEQEKQ